MKNKNLSNYLSDFLIHYLPELKNVSENTLSTYCDSFRYFLTYCQEIESIKIEKMSVSDLNADLIERYLQWMETEKGNSKSTCNNRLAAIHSFVKYLQPREPQLLLNFQQILSISTTKIQQKPVQPLSKNAIRTLLRQPNTSTLKGRRDATILCVLKLSITLDTLTARILKLSSNSQSRIEPAAFYSWWNTTDCRADSAVAPVAHEISPDHRF